LNGINGAPAAAFGPATRDLAVHITRGDCTLAAFFPFIISHLRIFRRFSPVAIWRSTHPPASPRIARVRVTLSLHDLQIPALQRRWPVCADCNKQRKEGPVTSSA
jgi:hypothetical protein